MDALSAATLHRLDHRVAVPAYDRSRVTAGVVHVGVGAFHRAHQAVYHDRLLGEGALEWGICGVGVLPSDRRVHEALAAQDGLYTVLVKHSDGTIEPRVIGSIVELLLAPDDPAAVVERLADPRTRIVTMTITEGGYDVDDDTGAFRATSPGVAHDLAEPAEPRTVFGLVVEGLRLRRERGIAPFAVMSCDNLQGNGEIARRAFAGFAALRDAELGAWIERAVAFPSTVVDRITPRTTELDRDAVRDLFGVEDRAPVVCEPFSQWVLEEPGAARRPPYEQAGVRIVDDAAPHERMKLRLLNGGHQAFAYLGLLAGHVYVHEAAGDPAIRAFVERYLDAEAAPTLGGVPADDVAAFRGALLGRFGNRAVADTLVRLATDASDRIPQFILPVIRERLAAGGDVTRSAAIVASWARWCAEAAAEHGATAIPDDRRDSLAARARRSHDDPDAFVSDREVFGDLAEDERFRGPYRAALSTLDGDGVTAALASLA